MYHSLFPSVGLVGSYIDNSILSITHLARGPFRFVRLLGEKLNALLPRVDSNDFTYAHPYMYLSCVDDCIGITLAQNFLISSNFSFQ